MAMIRTMKVMANMVGGLPLEFRRKECRIRLRCPLFVSAYDSQSEVEL